MKKGTRLQIIFSEELLEDLDHKAKATGLDRTNFIKMAVKTYTIGQASINRSEDAGTSHRLQPALREMASSFNNDLREVLESTMSKSRKVISLCTLDRKNAEKFAREYAASNDMDENLVNMYAPEVQEAILNGFYKLINGQTESDQGE